jgi:hypothetical protein
LIAAFIQLKGFAEKKGSFFFSNKLMRKTREKAARRAVP